MDFLSLFMNVAGGLSVSSVLEMIACLVLTVRIVTIPIIMRWVTVPTYLVFVASSFYAKSIGDQCIVLAASSVYAKHVDDLLY